MIWVFVVIKDVGIMNEPSESLPKFEIVQINDNDLICTTTTINPLVDHHDNGYWLFNNELINYSNRFLISHFLMFLDGATQTTQGIYNRNLYLYEEGEVSRPRVSSLLSRLANYDDAIQTAPTDGGPTGNGLPQGPIKKANLGALFATKSFHLLVYI